MNKYVIKWSNDIVTAWTAGLRRGITKGEYEYAAKVVKDGLINNNNGQSDSYAYIIYSKTTKMPVAVCLTGEDALKAMETKYYKVYVSKEKIT